MSPVINWAPAEYKLAEPGVYPATFTKWELKNAKPNKDKEVYPYIAMEFTLDNNSKQFQNLSLSPNALARTKKALITLGADPYDFGVYDEDGDTITEAAPVEDILAGIMGNSCLLDIGVESYVPAGEEEEKERNKINAIRPG